MAIKSLLNEFFWNVQLPGLLEKDQTLILTLRYENNDLKSLPVVYNKAEKKITQILYSSYENSGSFLGNEAFKSTNQSRKLELIYENIARNKDLIFEKMKDFRQELVKYNFDKNPNLLKKGESFLATKIHTNLPAIELNTLRDYISLVAQTKYQDVLNLDSQISHTITNLINRSPSGFSLKFIAEIYSFKLSVLKGSIESAFLIFKNTIAKNTVSLLSRVVKQATIIGGVRAVGGALTSFFIVQTVTKVFGQTIGTKAGGALGAGLLLTGVTIGGPFTMFLSVVGAAATVVVGVALDTFVFLQDDEVLYTPAEYEKLKQNSVEAQNLTNDLDDQPNYRDYQLYIAETIYQYSYVTSNFFIYNFENQYDEENKTMNVYDWLSSYYDESYYRLLDELRETLYSNRNFFGQILNDNLNRERSIRRKDESYIPDYNKAMRKSLGEYNANKSSQKTLDIFNYNQSQKEREQMSLIEKVLNFEPKSANDPLPTGSYYVLSTENYNFFESNRALLYKHRTTLKNLIAEENKVNPLTLGTINSFIDTVKAKFLLIFRNLDKVNSETGKIEFKTKTNNPQLEEQKPNEEIKKEVPPVIKPGENIIQPDLSKEQKEFYDNIRNTLNNNSPQQIENKTTNETYNDDSLNTGGYKPPPSDNTFFGKELSTTDQILIKTGVTIAETSTLTKGLILAGGIILISGALKRKKSGGEKKESNKKQKFI